MLNKNTILLSVCLLSSMLSAQRLIVGNSARVLSEIDLVTPAQNTIGTITSNVGTLGALAYDTAGGHLYASSTTNDSLFLIDPTNWNAKLIGAYGDSAIVMHGMEWDSSTSTLYGYSYHNDGLYSIDTNTGVATLLGSTGLTGFGNLGYDPLLDAMLLSDTTTDSLYWLDRSTLVATLIGPLNGPTNPHELAYNIDNQTMYLVCSNTDIVYSLDYATGAATTVLPLTSANYLAMAYVPGTGRLVRQIHGCGPTTLFVSGNPNIGGSVDFTIENTTGFGFVGFGTASITFPFCGCTVGHEWSVAVIGPTVTLPIPGNPALIGASVYAQGLDFLGAGGCADPMLTLTDTIEIQIGA